MNSSNRAVSTFVLNFMLANKFEFPNAFALPSFEKVVLNSFIQDLDKNVSTYYLRCLLILELLTSQRVIIKNIKKTLKGKKSYQVVVSHYVVLRKNLLYNFFYFFVFFGLRGLEEKFLKINHSLNNDGTFYLRLKDVTALPGLSEEFFKWPYSLDCFFVSRKIDNRFLSKFFFRYLGFPFVY
jgi:ribosomal protein L5